MASREVQKLLFDMKQAGELIEAFIVGRSFEEYRSDAMFKSAVERQYGIIGDALSRAFAIDSGLESRITSLRRIIDFLNRLIHGYADVSAAVVWGVLESELPVLLAAEGIAPRRLHGPEECMVLDVTREHGLVNTCQGRLRSLEITAP